MDLARPWWFWGGTLAVVVGVLIHLAMFFDAKDMDYMLNGMDVSPLMIVGMALVIPGLACTVVGVVPRGSRAVAEQASRIRVRALDDAKLSPTHVALLLVMALAVTVDIAKATTLGFVVPGFSLEYDLRSQVNPGGGAPAALYPLAGIAGTVIGSFVWGWLGDRIGRRSSILIAGMFFIATSLCGVMPDWRLNLVMCFVMGLAVGGMLPIAFALLAETIPARHRGWIMVLIGGDIAGAYLMTSALAQWLEPTYGWRILWLTGAPSGLLLILLNRWIPESPRYLLARGRESEAIAIMKRFGARVVDEAAELKLPTDVAARAGFRQLLRRPFGRLTMGLGVYALAYGLVNFGFLLWLPSNLRHLGLGVGASDELLAKSALLALPVIGVVAFLYGRWSSKYTMMLVAAASACTLTTFAILGDSVVEHETLLNVLIVLVIVSTSSAAAILTPYSAEVYPTRIRSRGTGFVAGTSKAGGVIGLLVVVLATSPPGLASAALIGAVAMAIAVVAVGWVAFETRQRGLEDITAEELETHTGPLLAKAT